MVDIDPKQICGFDPCELSKCLLSPLGSCVSDYKCRPVFFDVNNKQVDDCVGMYAKFLVVLFTRGHKVINTCTGL